MCVVLYSTGSEFHSVGPETAKLCEPMRTVRVRGTARFPCAAVRRRWEPLGLPTGEIISTRYMYEGASPVTMQALVVLRSAPARQVSPALSQMLRGSRVAAGRRMTRMGIGLAQGKDSNSQL